MITLLFMVLQVFADDCPDLRGLYASDRIPYLNVSQVGCARVDMERVEVRGRSPVPQTFIPDGERHPVGAYFYAARWDDQKLVLEPFATAAGGEMIGLRTTWSLDPDGSLRENFLNEDGSLYDYLVYYRR